MVDLGAASKYRKVMAGLYLGNKLSGPDAAEVYRSSTAAGAQGVEDICKTGASGKHPQNLARDMMRKFVKDNDWPEYYWAKIPYIDTKTGMTSQCDLPFLLPHEVRASLHSKNNLLQHNPPLQTMPPGVQKHIAKFRRECKIVGSPIIPCGL